MIERAALEEIEAILREPRVLERLGRAEALCARRHQWCGEKDSGDPVSYAPPARPSHWTVLPATEVPRRPRLSDPRGRQLLMHSVAHIELSAVELALLAVGHFPDEEIEYHRDMLRIAGEEIAHTRMLIRRLNELGCELGAHPVHLDLWEVAVGHQDVIDRLVVVPRVLEARGLDVSGNMRRKLRGAGDEHSAALLDIIYGDEIGHVAIGTRWFRRLCARRGIDPEQRFFGIAERHRKGRGDAFIDREGRLKAGFTERELDFISRRADPATATG